MQGRGLVVSVTIGLLVGALTVGADMQIRHDGTPGATGPSGPSGPTGAAGPSTITIGTTAIANGTGSAVLYEDQNHKAAESNKLKFDDSTGILAASGLLLPAPGSYPALAATIYTDTTDIPNVEIKYGGVEQFAWYGDPGSGGGIGVTSQEIGSSDGTTFIDLRANSATADGHDPIFLPSTTSLVDYGSPNGLLFIERGNVPMRFFANNVEALQLTGAGNVASVGAGRNLTMSGVVTGLDLRATPVAVGSLPTCNAGAEGTSASVNDSNAVSFTLGIGAIVANGGTTHVPVWCDGTNWRIG